MCCSFYVFYFTKHGTFYVIKHVSFCFLLLVSYLVLVLVNVLFRTWSFVLVRYPIRSGSISDTHHESPYAAGALCVASLASSTIPCRISHIEIVWTVVFVHSISYRIRFSLDIRYPLNPIIVRYPISIEPDYCSISDIHHYCSISDIHWTRFSFVIRYPFNPVLVRYPVISDTHHYWWCPTRYPIFIELDFRSISDIHRTPFSFDIRYPSLLVMPSTDCAYIAWCRPSLALLESAPTLSSAVSVLNNHVRMLALPAVFCVFRSYCCPCTCEMAVHPLWTMLLVYELSLSSLPSLT